MANQYQLESTKHIEPESFENYIPNGAYDYFYTTTPLEERPQFFTRFPHSMGIAGPFDDDWSIYAKNAGYDDKVVPIDTVEDRTRENGWYKYPDGRWGYFPPRDQRMATYEGGVSNKLQALYNKIADKF